MKTYVVGAPGSGKTTYARILAQANNVAYLDLDTVKWISNGRNTYFSGHPLEERLKMLSDFLSTHDSWVCDGVYYTDWIYEMLFAADVVILIQTPLWLRQWRVLKRAFKPEYRQNESVRGMIKLMRWNHNYDKNCLPVLLNTLRENNIKYKIVNCKQIKGIDKWHQH